MMTCEDYKQRLPDLHTGRLTAAQKNELEQHLDSCAACREALAATVQILDHIGSLPDPEPSTKLKADFRVMLDDFKTAEARRASRLHLWQWLLQPQWKLVYGFILFLGIGGAYLLGRSHRQDEIVRQTHTGVSDPKQTQMLALLKNPLASERLRAVNYAGELKAVDKQVVDALLTTLNTDPNDNVRLSALESLSRLSANPEVRMGLIQSITTQNSPVIQLAIADVMLKLQEKGSVGSFKQLLKQKDLDNEVRNKVKETITQLI